MPRTAYPDTFASDQLPPRQWWPELRFELPELQYPEQLNCVTPLLDEAIAAACDRVALRSYADEWTYYRLLQAVNRIARVLWEDLKLVPGNRVLLRGENTPMTAACFLAILKAGCIAVPTMPMLRAKELHQVLDKAQVNAVLCSQTLKSELEASNRLLPRPAAVMTYHPGGEPATESSRESSLEKAMASKPDSFEAYPSLAEDVAMIVFTSGTTGVPKATMHFHRDLLAICDCFPRAMLQAREDDIFIGTPPLAFTFGLGGLLLFPLRFRATTVLLERPAPEALLQAIQDFRATLCFTAPAFYRRMAPLASRYDLASLRKAVSAGEALPAATRAQWKQATGLQLIDGLGSTEMLHIFISADENEVRPGSTGKPIPGYTACVLDESGQPLPPGQVGRLAVKGPTGCRYLADARQQTYVCNGWNVTGDAFEMDADGYFTYRARLDDMIISAGYNIAGPEVEEALLQHPAVQECAVVGAPDAERGQIVKAFVVLQDGHAPSDALIKEMQGFVKQTIAPYKYPRAIEFVESLPRTESGKLQRFRLRDVPPSPLSPEGQ
jgi:2-aminobenzoate-CoA ligase